MADAVPETSPMKRGLKAALPAGQAGPSICSRDFPDEEGTESLVRGPGAIYVECSRDFPDEEGTERLMRA